MSLQRPPWWRRVTLRDTLIFTGPPLALALWVFGSACLDYQRIRQFDDWWSNATSVRKFGFNRLRAVWNLPRATALRERIPAEDESRQTIRLRVDRSEWSELSRDVGGHWGEWIRGALVDGNDHLDVRLRFRGDGSAHWTSEKKSLSVKTGKDALYKGFRRLNFSVKDVLPQYLANSLAADFDLLAPETEVVPLYVNEHYYGIFRFIEPVDEAFLRRHRRMPGNVFRGDTAERGEYFKNLPRELFANPEIWDRVAANDRPGAPREWAVRGLIEDLNGSTFEDHRRLMKRLDQGELSRLLALMLACGDPFHMSGIHNQLWYEDPATGVLHPVVWDLRLLDLEHPLPHSNWNRFWRAVLREPAVLDGALGHLARWIEDDRLLDLARRRVVTTYAQYRDHFEYDQLRAGVIPPVGRPGEVLARLRKNLEVLREWTRDTRVRVATGPWVGDLVVVDLLVGGRAGAELAGFAFEAGGSPPGDVPGDVEVWADANLSGRLDEGDLRLGARSLEQGVEPRRILLEPPQRLLPGVAASGAELAPEPLHYRFFVRAADGRAELPRLEPLLVSLHAATPVRVEAWEPGEAVPEAASWHPWRSFEPAGETRVLAGEVFLERDLVVPEGSTLVIEPGATLALGPDVSIVSFGRVEARGTARAPITVAAAEEDLPWGVFALQGPGASGSRLEHVRFRGGGGARVGRVEYKGAVCVHAAEDVEFRRSAFSANLRCDDLLNVVQAEVDLVQCTFDDANADSIDYDMSTGRIVGCEIRNSGNDGLDLMTASPLVARCTIAGSGDKGISVGEAARPRIVECLIEGCERGLEVKDLSEPLIVDTEVRGNTVGLLQRRKNWRYGGAGRAKWIGGFGLENDDPYEGLDGALLTRHEGDADWFRALATGGARRVAGGAFRDDLRHTTGGWRRSGGARWLAVKESALAATFRRGEGAIGRRVDWRLAADGSRYALVIEAAGEGLEDVRVGLSTELGTLERELVLDPLPGVARYTIIELAPGTYEGIAITARPVGGAGTLRLLRCVVLARPWGEL